MPCAGASHDPRGFLCKQIAGNARDARESKKLTRHRMNIPALTSNLVQKSTGFSQNINPGEEFAETDTV